MKLKKIDKGIILVSIMFIICEIIFSVEIIRGTTVQEYAIGNIVLVLIHPLLIWSYLKHRHEYV